MEHKIGEIVALPDRRKAEVVEVKHCFCFECIFRGDCHGCSNIAGECAALDRTDHKDVIYKEIKED